jgi:hypothetical protein
MTSMTSPTAGNGGQSATIGAGAQRATSPMAAGFSAGAPSAETIAAVQAGIATQYWNECVAFPAGSAASLWLFVDNAWRAHDNPSASSQDMVQRAFLGSGSTVRVWYDGAKVVGLVVSG